MSLTRDPKIKDLWHARIYPDGRKKDPKTGKPSNMRETYRFSGSEIEAREWYRSLNKSVKPTKVVKLAPTIDQVYDDFTEYYKNTVSDRTLGDFILTYDRHLKSFFGQYRPKMITPALIEAYKTKRSKDSYLPGKRGQKIEDDTPEETKKRKPITKRTVQKEINYIQSFLRWMTDPDIALADPLTFRIRNYKASQTEAPPKVIPSRRDMLLLIRSCRDVVKEVKKDGKIVYERQDRKYRRLFAVAYYAGVRRSELFALESSNIDRQQGYIRIQGKGNKNRTIPIVTRLKPYIRRMTQKGKLFLNEDTNEEYDNVSRLLSRSCKKIGIPVISLHTFRHAFAVHALMRGVSLRTLQLVMGHSSIKTTERYLQLVPNDLALDLDKVPWCNAPRRTSNERSKPAAL